MQVTWSEQISAVGYIYQDGVLMAVPSVVDCMDSPHLGEFMKYETELNPLIGHSLKYKASA